MLIPRFLATKIKLEPDYYQKHPGKLPEEPVLTQVFNTIDPVLLQSKVIQYYLELGCDIQIEYFIQYKAEKCFKPFTDQVVNLRMSAKRDGNDAKGITAKLIGNSSYGKCLGNLIIEFKVISFRKSDPISKMYNYK